MSRRRKVCFHRLIGALTEDEDRCMRILLIEDDPSTARGIELALKSEDYSCDLTHTGEEALSATKRYAYDVILLDLMLPDIDGLEVLRRMRACKVGVPVLILSGLDDVAVKSKGLNSGADDYLVKPFENRELLGRIQAVLRRSKGYRDRVVRTGELSVNLDTQTVEMNGRRMYLTPKEYQILELLLQRKGMVLSKGVFLNHLYGGMDVPDQKIIDVFVCKLRKKLSWASGGKNYIETDWGRGYVLRERTGPAPENTDMGAGIADREAA